MDFHFESYKIKIVLQYTSILNIQGSLHSNTEINKVKYTLMSVNT